MQNSQAGNLGIMLMMTAADGMIDGGKGRRTDCRADVGRHLQGGHSSPGKVPPWGGCSCLAISFLWSSKSVAWSAPSPFPATNNQLALITLQP